MSNRNFDASSMTQRLANKAVAKSILTQNQSANPYFFQPQTSNFNASVMNEVESGNQLYVTRGDTCVTLDPGCPCPGAITAVLEPTCSGIKTPLSSYANLGAVQWATYMRGNGGSAPGGRVMDIATDSQGNVYMVGSGGNVGGAAGLVETYNVNGNGQSASIFNLPSSINERPYLIKYSSAGQVVWALQLTTFQNGVGTYAIAIDSADNVLITGQYFATTIQNVNEAILSPPFNNSPPSPQPVSQQPSTSPAVILPVPIPPSSSISTRFAFVIKYTTNGKPLWATYFDGVGSSADQGNGIAVDTNDDVYVSGVYNSTTSVTLLDATSGGSQTPSSIGLPATGGGNASFLIKYNASGVVQWATNQMGVVAGSCNAIVCDNCDFVYVAGFYTSDTAVPLQNASGTGQTPSITVQLPGAATTGVDTAYLAKYDTNGIAQWATYLVGNPSNQGTTQSNQAFGVCVDYNNNVYVTGTYSCSPLAGPVLVINGSTLSPSGITLETTNGNKENSMFLIKYTPVGVAQWATFLGKTGASGRAVTFDGLNNIYVAGQYTQEFPVTPSPQFLLIQNATATGQTPSGIGLPKITESDRAGFVIKYNTNGIGQFAAYIDTASFADISYAIHVDPLDNRLYMGGQFNASTAGPIALFNATTGISYTNSLVTLPGSQTYGFIIKYQ